ncbi:MAG: ABC transporter ATP-binding protein [Ruminiclostridium sp.]|nr:ABC transporter ATP-binding protein [Ruminiclostridium sp.]
MKISTGDKAALSWIWKSSAKYRFRILLLTLGNMVFAGASVLFALMCRGIVDGAVDSDRNAVIKSGAGLLMVILGMLLLRLFCNAVEETIRAGLEKEYRGIILNSLLKKDYEKISAYHSGELMNRMFSDVAVVTDGAAGILPSVMGMVTKLAGAAAVLMALDMSFALIFIGAGAVLFLVSRLFRKHIKKLHKQVQETGGQVRSFLQETLEGLLVIKAFGAEEKMSRINENNQDKHYKARLKRRSVTISANAGFGFVFQAGYLYAILWGAFGIMNGVMTYGTLTAILQLVNQIQQPFAALSAVMPKFYSMTASAERITELLNLPEEPQAEKKADYEKLNRITVKNVDFSYGENHVLNNVNIEINNGEIISLTGISGGGKSTLFLLLLGAYRPQRGDIIFEAENGSFSAGRETRGLFAYVPQGNLLFSGTVRDNITFLNETATEEEINAAAETACALNFINELPEGMETKIGENGFGISEGQAQRIAIARAILGGAPILLLDEATSALDETTEAALLNNIRRMKNKTALIVTHRPAALEICSRHLILKEGNLTYGDLQ